jgi:hypothetical protein
MTLDQHVSYTATSDLSAAQARRLLRIQLALSLYRETKSMTPAFAIESLKRIGLSEEAARTMVEGVKRP